MSNTHIYRDEMFEAISNIIEQVGAKDPDYDLANKAADILVVFESLLAYAIFNTSDSPETIRDSCEESYVNIKKRALAIFKQFGEDSLPIYEESIESH